MISQDDILAGLRCMASGAILSLLPERSGGAAIKQIRKTKTGGFMVIEDGSEWQDAEVLSAKLAVLGAQGVSIYKPT